MFFLCLSLLIMVNNREMNIKPSCVYAREIYYNYYSSEKVHLLHFVRQI